MNSADFIKKQDGQIRAQQTEIDRLNTLIAKLQALVRELETDNTELRERLATTETGQ